MQEVCGERTTQSGDSDRQTGWQAGRQADRQAGRQAEAGRQREQTIVREPSRVAGTLKQASVTQLMTHDNSRNAPGNISSCCCYPAGGGEAQTHSGGTICNSSIWETG